MKNWILIFFVIGGLIAGGVYYWRSHSREEDKQKINTQNIAASPSPEEHYPVLVNSADASSLPSLDKSDAPFEAQLFTLLSRNTIEAVFEKKDLIRRIVLITLNAQETSWPADGPRPFKSPLGTLKTKEVGGIIALDTEKNRKRYAPYLRIAQEVNLKSLVQIYARYYPLFQSAYKELEPKGEFNDLLIKVIDHLLETPSPALPIQLIQLSSSYKYLDASLEDLSVSQKTLIRASGENEDSLKEEMRELRKLLTNLNK